MTKDTQTASGPRYALGKVPCVKHCGVCDGQDHHWDYFGDADEAGEPVYSCKHCEAIKEIGDDDEN